MLMNVTPNQISSLKDTMFNRFEEINKQMERDIEFKEAWERITAGYTVIKEKDPVLYNEAMNPIDSGYGRVICMTQERYYIQGLIDALGIAEILKGGVQ